MSFATIFSVIMAAVLLRIFWLKVRAAGMHSENFKRLAPKDKLAVLKECLLNNPTETNLKNLEEFTEKHNIAVNVNEYRKFMKEQLSLSKSENAIAKDNELFVKEATWLDNIKPLEFAEALTAKKQNVPDFSEGGFIERSLEGIAKLYSDAAIFAELNALVEFYPKAKKLSEQYASLVKLRESSGTSEAELASLRSKKQLWEQELLNIEENFTSV